ncbi:putative cell cycle control protein [Phaeomoniella chlamydospora]|uniref:Pre-mRNA-processing factor 19 n=1 Tax=Phaeomoniella chlamydospora TaxID=158046 RepID=A0A0G2ENR0_PHACM|nr:putative cell cycle control protein [Phaeomoniella chlamydospora]
MLCAISGEAPQFPVASRKSGAVYEKRLIEAYITENGTEPGSGESLTVEDLIELKSSRIVRPRPPTLTSIPSLLGIFQEEWDAFALETYTLKQNLAQTRQELSTALYQHDAAVRVIARLTRERDEARDALSKVSVGARATSSNGDAMQVDVAGLPDSVLARLDATQEALSKTRRKRPVPEDWATGEEIATYAPATTSEALYPGSKVLALDASGDNALVGGSDGIAGIYSLSQKRVLRALKGGNGSITDGVWAGSNPVIATSTGKVKVFDGQQETASFEAHAGVATSLAVHPSGDIVASVGVDKSYILYDLSTSQILRQVYTGCSLSTVRFHPDGHLLAAGGADGNIKIFDVKSGSSMAEFECSNPLQALFFSENGTWLAAVTQGASTVSIWDLRKSAVVHTLNSGGKVDTIAWDYTGQFLAAAGPGGLTVHQYSKASKGWSEPLQIAVPASAVQWSTSAKSLVAVNTEGVISVLTASG